MPFNHTNSGSKGNKPLDAKTLRRSQLRALDALFTAGANQDGGIACAVTIEEIARRAKVTVGYVRQGLGAVKNHEREEHDRHWGYRSLLTRGMVRVIPTEEGAVYHLTALGESVAEQRLDELVAVRQTPPNKSGRENLATRRTHKKRRTKLES